MASKKKKSFEEQLQQLEYMLSEMENGNKPLDQVLSLYENGMAIVRNLENELAATEQRLTVLREQDNGTYQEEPFEEMGT